MMLFTEPFSILFLLVLVLVGRILLAALPPGEPGGMRPSEWPATYAASLLLGGVAMRVIFGLGPLAMALGGLLIAGLAVSRLVARPSAMRPRHEPASAPSTRATRAAWWCAWALSITVFVVRSERTGTVQQGRDWMAFGMVLALAALLDWAMRVARCNHAVRAAALAALAAIVFVAPLRLAQVESAVYFAAGAASTIAWYRRADRRALTLAAAFYAATILTSREGWVLASAGAFVLVGGTARASRRVALFTTAAAIALTGTVHLLWPGKFEPVQPLGFSNVLYAIMGVLFAAVLIARWWDLRGLRLPTWNPSGAAVGHERAMLLRTLLFALLIAWLARAMRLDMSPDFALVPALFVLVILFGSSLDRLLGRG